MKPVISAEAIRKSNPISLSGRMATRPETESRYRKGLIEE